MSSFPSNDNNLVSGSRLKAQGEGPVAQLKLKKGDVLVLYSSWSGVNICARNPRNADDYFTWTPEQLCNEIVGNGWWEVLPPTWFSRHIGNFRAWWYGL